MAMKLTSAVNGGMIERMESSCDLAPPLAWREGARNLWPDRQAATRMSSLSRGFLRASAWAVLAAVLGTALWILFVATAAPLVEGKPFRDIAGFWMARAIAAFYFGGTVAALAIIPHALLFTAWFTVIGRYPTWRRRVGNRSIGSLVLSVPFVVAVFGSYAAPSHGLGPFWLEAFVAIPWILLSTWGGIFLARVVIESQKGTSQPVAA